MLEWTARKVFRNSFNDKGDHDEPNRLGENIRGDG